MKILLINNYGYVRGGTERYFLDSGKLLESKGHDIRFFCTFSEKNIVDAYSPSHSIDIERPRAMDVPKFIYSRDTKRALENCLTEFRPDLVHLHTYYGQLTAAILPVLRRANVRVVQTLHDYKLLCPVSSLVRDGRPCEACADGAFWHAALFRCNRGRLARSMASALESYASHALGARSSVNRFLAVSEFVRKKVVEHGLPEDRISVVHNFVSAESFTSSQGAGKYILYFGRLETIKGLGTLIEAMKAHPDTFLYVVGDGEARPRFEAQAYSTGEQNVCFLGYKSGRELRQLIAGAICVISPSEWWETFGLVLLESFAAARPVIASRMGGMTEVVSDGVDGLLFEAGNVADLSNKLGWMIDHPDKAIAMGLAGQRKASEQFSESGHYEQLISAYSAVLTQ